MGATAKMKAGIYSPYWDTLGGGEYYAASVAKSLKDLGFNVEIFSSDSNIVSLLEDRFDLNLSQIKVNPLGVDVFKGNLIDRWKFTREYDVLFIVSDGSIPTVFGKNNILHFQVPFTKVKGSKLINRLKLTYIHHVVCNSKFTKSYIDKEFNVISQVIYPAVVPHKVNSSTNKQNIILSVGRFDNLMQSKRQDVLIEAFKKINLKGWKLILAGGVLHGQGFVNKLKKMSDGLNIEIMTNISHQELASLYQKSKIFWHAAGFGLDISANPQKAEHFGISTVEAMSAGLVPVVFNGGGLKEIITNKTGYLWKTIAELLDNTHKAIKVIDNQQNIARVIDRSKVFSQERFNEEIKKLVS
jgi:glycosyltransferase involved in cell wall biosynthesis